MLTNVTYQRPVSPPEKPTLFLDHVVFGFHGNHLHQLKKKNAVFFFFFFTIFWPILCANSKMKINNHGIKSQNYEMENKISTQKLRLFIQKSTYGRKSQNKEINCPNHEVDCPIK